MTRGKVADVLLEEEFIIAWASKTCVCGQSKWAHYPFCRRCSIRLQRASLYRFRVFCGNQVPREAFDEPIHLAHKWDVCKDFLLCAKGDHESQEKRVS